MIIENGYVSLNKVGEELCGDKVEVIKKDDKTTIVLADGLGSGVKANILATLTSKILCTMLSQDIPLNECIETIISSLPVCKVRGIAYATFSIIHINNEGTGYLVEFDNPEAIFVRDKKCHNLDRTKLLIQDKIVYYSDLKLKNNDYLVINSDGVIHAGIGKLLNFGWLRDDIKTYIEQNLDEHMSARCLSALIGEACRDLYMEKPGDDTTIACIKFRTEMEVNIMVGPPLDKNQDDYFISTFLAKGDKRIVCGGTSSQIVAKHLGTKVTTNLDYLDKEIPPIGYINGIDLTTEGVLTLRKLMELSDKYLNINDVDPKYFKKKDGASQLANILFEEATKINFYVGTSINLAHQGLPIDTTMKLKLVEKLNANLQKMDKITEINYF